MDQPRTDETFRDFLDRRERELAQQICALKEQLTPKEAEFAEIRRTKANLGITAVTRLADVAGELDGMTRRMLEIAVRQASPKEMPIKDLIVRAFVEHFPGGATPSEIGFCIQQHYGRQIDSGSIRPNLGRLRNEGLVIHDSLASRWILNPAAAGTMLLYYANEEDRALLKRAAELAWTAEDDEASAKTEQRRLAVTVVENGRHTFPNNEPAPEPNPPQGEGIKRRKI